MKAKLCDPAVYRARVEECGRVDAVLGDCVRTLREQGASQAAKYIARARKSVQGAARHASRLFNEARSQC